MIFFGKKQETRSVVKRGSILAYSLIILSMMLAIVTTLSVTTIIGKKSASITQFSVQSIQTADSGVQLALKKINAELNREVLGVMVPPRDIDTALGGGVCIVNKVTSLDGVAGPAGSSFELLFFDESGTQLNCDAIVSQIASIKSIGTYKNTVRAVNVSVTTKKSRAILDMNAIAVAIKSARTATSQVAGLVTESFCSECACLIAPPDIRNIASSDPCYSTWNSALTKIEAKAGLALGSLTGAYARDPWGSPYLLDENENEPGFSPCRQEVLFSAGPDGNMQTPADNITLTPPIPFFTAACL